MDSSYHIGKKTKEKVTGAMKVLTVHGSLGADGCISKLWGLQPLGSLVVPFLAIIRSGCMKKNSHQGKGMCSMTTS